MESGYLDISFLRYMWYIGNSKAI